MNGFNVFSDSFCEQEFDNSAGLFRLLVDDNIEIFESIVNPGKSIICQPYESADSINVLFIKKGRLFHTNECRVIHPGQRIVFKNLEYTHHLSVLEKTEILMIREKKFFTEQASNSHLVYDYIHKIQDMDQYTEAHCNSTGNLAVQIATLMHLSETSVHDILHAGKIHDVGKLYVPKDILVKPSKLTDEEYQHMKRHPQMGHDLIMKTLNNESYARIVLQHHEKLDGSGYPYGLTGDDICIEAKVVSVADSYDAMISDRPYKSAVSPEEALADIKSHAGTWYDPKVVHTLEKIVEINQSIVRNRDMENHTTA